MVELYRLLSLFHWVPREKAILNLLSPIIREHTERHYRIIDIGCGPGMLLNSFRMRNISYIGIDTDNGSIEYAKKLHPHCKKTVSFILTMICQTVEFIFL